MSDLTLASRPALAGFASPGRSGRSEGRAGVVAEERALALATLMARRGRASDLAAAIGEAYGLDLPTTPRRAAGQQIALLWSGPDQWLVTGEAPDRDLEAEMRARFGGLASVSDQGSSRLVLRLSGPRVREALRKGLPIDLHPRAFAPGDVAVTVVGHIGVQIWQLDAAPTFELAVYRGFAGSFWRWLEASSAEFGLDLVRSA